MSDKKEEKKDDAHSDGHGEKKAAGGGIKALLTKLPVILGGAMVVEAAVIFGGLKLLGGGAAKVEAVAIAHADSEHGDEAEHSEKKEEGHGEAADAGHGDSGSHGEAADDGHGEKKPASKPLGNGKDPVELPLFDFRAPNKQSGKTFLYDVSLYVIVPPKSAELVKAKIAARDALIKDRVRTIIAQSDPDRLGGGSEPGLETLRRQVKYQLDQILGDGMVQEVLIPRCIPYRADF